MSSSQSQVSTAIARIWFRHESSIRERVLQIEKTVQTLIAGQLSEEQRRLAGENAHKLAGNLGTFGNAAGSEHARAVEAIMLAERSLASDDIEPLRAHAERLQVAVREIAASVKKIN